MGDPFLDSILRGLEGELDPNKFERCVTELIRLSDYPGTAHVPGGNDAGMDGAVLDREGGSPFPIITTTQKDVVQNLVKSLRRTFKNIRCERPFSRPRAVSAQICDEGFPPELCVKRWRQ